MSREIYTYHELSELANNEGFAKIKQYPIVTVSADFRKSFKGERGVDRVEGIFSKQNDIKVVEFRALSDAIDGEWNSDRNKFEQLTLISEFFRRRLKAAENDKKTYRWLTGCMRNMNSILSGIMLLEQADVKPQDIPNTGDRNIEIFIEVWKYLLEKSTVLSKFHTHMELLTTKDKWKEKLNLAFKDNNVGNTDAIIFHGFYYITPYQERIMRLLETAKYKLIFLIPYDERFRFVHEIWEHTYSVERGYPDRNRWYKESKTETDVHGALFEGKKVELPNQLEIKEYASVMEFVDNVKRIREQGYSMYSPDHRNANAILKDYFPEEYGERKVLSYPIGQFISNLNQMWDSSIGSDGDIVLEEERLIECFSSGWLAVNGISGKQYMQDLIYMLPFFGGCRTIRDWEKRIDLLKKIKEDVVSPFEIELDADEAVARWQEAIGNPFNNFSVFAVSNEKMDVILSLIKQLLDMARELFGKNEPVHVQDHIAKLQNILKRHEISDELYEEELELISGIFEKLNQPGLAVTKCYPADISNAMSLYFCGRLDEGELQNDKVGLVYPFYFVDAACVKNDGKVHICMCDVNSLPGGNKDYIWPLTGDLVRKMYERTGNPLLVNLMQIMEENALCNRYFFYCAIKNRDVQISWISELNEKLLAPSPYIRLICEASGIKVKQAKRNMISFDRIKDAPIGADKIDVYTKEKAPMGMIKEARMDYALCPMRYVLGYVVEKYPSYQSEFQQNYALNALISAIHDLLKEEGITVDQVYKEVISLFPNMRTIEKRQVYDYLFYERKEDDMDYKHRTECGGHLYTDERIKIHYPSPEVRAEAITQFGKLVTPDGRKNMNLYEVMDEVVGACTFCPHIEYCRNALFSTDQENYYD